MIRILIGCITLLGITNISYATITATGDYEPTDLSSLSSGQCVDQMNAGTIMGRYGMISLDGSDVAVSCNMLNVGGGGLGTLNILNGAKVNYMSASIGTNFFGVGIVNVRGVGAELTTTDWCSMQIASNGTAEINILNGGKVKSASAIVANGSAAKANVIVSGQDSEFVTNYLRLGGDGLGYMSISNSGFVEADNLSIGENANVGSAIDMATNGQLRIVGSAYSIDEFLNLIDGTGSIRYWDGSVWADIAGASEDVYTLTHSFEYDSYNQRDDYTTLTVHTIPEPASLFLVLMGFFALRSSRKA